MFSAHSKFAQALVAFCGAILTLAVPGLCLGQGATPTHTTLDLSSTSIQYRGTVTLKATVTSGNAPVYPGLVVVCNVNTSYCQDSAVLGEAQLTSNGTATVHRF